MQYPTHRTWTRTRPSVYKSHIYQRGHRKTKSSSNQAIRYSKYQSSLYGRPLSSIFRPLKEQQKCPESCETCISAKKVNKCISKNCVYIIECMHCHLIYIGLTSRTVGSRIKEYLRMKKRTIYQYIFKHTNTPMLKDISCDILHNNIPQHQTRKIIEALEISKKNTETIMNGCIERVLTIQ